MMTTHDTANRVDQTPNPEQIDAVPYLNLTEGEQQWSVSLSANDMTPGYLSELADEVLAAKIAHRQQDNHCTSARYARLEFALRSAAHQLALVNGARHAHAVLAKILRESGA